MISSVTPAIISALCDEALASKLGLTASVFLIILLIVKELAGAGVDSTDNPRTAAVSLAIDHVVNIPIIPLLMVLVLSVIVRIFEVLQ